MSLLIDLPPELEQRLRQAADREGTDPGAYLARLVAPLLTSTPLAPVPTRLPPEEAGLLQQINLGIPAETWEAITTSSHAGAMKR